MTDRKYDRTHKGIRAAFMELLKPGTLCRRCNEPMWPQTQRLDLGHGTDGHIGYAIEHAACNRGAGNRNRGQKSAAGSANPPPSQPVTSPPVVARGYCDLPEGCRMPDGHAGVARCW